MNERSESKLKVSGVNGPEDSRVIAPGTQRPYILYGRRAEFGLTLAGKRLGAGGNTNTQGGNVRIDANSP